MRYRKRSVNNLIMNFLKDKIDVTAYLSRIRDIHKEPRVYHVDKEAMSVFEAIDAELTEIDEKSNHG